LSQQLLYALYQVAGFKHRGGFNAGLGKLNSSHQAFIEFFELDPHLVKAAAIASAPLQPKSNAPMVQALTQLSREESENFLRQVLNNEPQVRMALQKRLEQLAGT
jgi:hypothetical protein